MDQKYRADMDPSKLRPVADAGNFDGFANL